MPASASKANYKSFEAQARMVRAIVAAHPEVKWNYKEIVACYGSDMTADALNHRFRRLNAQAEVVRIARDQGFDMKNMDVDDKLLPAAKNKIDKDNIAKYFGQSTADGIQFQFRSIKKDAEKLRQVDRDGGDVANCLSLGAGSSVPVTPSRGMTAKQGGSRSGTTGKRARPIPYIKSDPYDEESDDVPNWDEEDQVESPSSKRSKTAPRGRKAGTPARLAAMKADATIAESFSQLPSSESPEEASTPSASASAAPAAVAPASIFGNVPERKPLINHGLASATFDDDNFNGMVDGSFLGGNINFLNGNFGSHGMDNTGEF